jgi:hypothetical protein
MKLLFLLLLLLAGIIKLCAQTNTHSNTTEAHMDHISSGVNIPLIVTDKFNTDHPHTIHLWQNEGENYSVEYRDTQNTIHLITYDTCGSIVRKEEEVVDKTNYPSNISLYYKETYPTENYSVWRCDDTQGNISYYSKRTASILLFDKNGNYLSSKLLITQDRKATTKN